MGVEFSAQVREAWPNPANGVLHHDNDADQTDNLPYLTESWLRESFGRLSDDECEAVLRDKMIACGWLPGETMFAVVEGSHADAGSRGRYSVIGRISLPQYQRAVRRHFGRQLLAKATQGLARTRPWASAHVRLSRGQVVFFSSFLAASAGLLAMGQGLLLQVLFQVLAAVLFLVVVQLRVLCLMPQPRQDDVPAPVVANAELPVYSVLVPLFRETEVLEQLLGALHLLDYPADKLDIKIILEEEDTAMKAALAHYQLAAHFDVITVPSGKPQTKPRALNYALQFARGSLLTIYDCEDIPEPNQLRLAAERFAQEGEDLACLQAALQYYNPNQNWLTRQFAAEYAGLFRIILPMLANYGLPLPLGGTSNHFRVAALNSTGGWDCFNVTEDADLGIRLARFGFRTGVLNSCTYEEANSEVPNWLRQRRRWLKGFLQTWLVHMRNPARLRRDLGWPGFLAVQAFTLGTFASALLHPVLVAHAIWTLLPEQVTASRDHILLELATSFSLLLLLLGYGTALAISARGLRMSGLPFSRWQLASMPCYWLLSTCAAWLAIWDFIVAPFHWHKTQHGLWMKTTPGDHV